MSARLEDLDVLVLDAQATGATPRHGELLEIGWTVARASAAPAPVVAHWLKLSERARVSRVVRELTGYSDPCAVAAVEPAAAWSSLLGAAREVAPPGERGAPTVIHFARFELAFLRDWHERFELAAERAFPFDVVCLHAVARRLYPSLPRSSIRALAGFLGHSTALERRAAGHVGASAHVWRRVVEDLRPLGVSTWDELVAFLSRPAGRRAARAFPMSKEARRALPSGPGVYRFVRSNGDVLYVGKAASIRKRVASHFTSARRTGERAMEMLTQAHRVEPTETPTALEAALLECDEVKRLDPPYNVQLRQATRSAWLLTRALDEPVTVPDDAHPLGPFPSRFSMSGYAAIRELLAGSEPTALLRARAVGAPLAFAPDEAVFGEGFGAFRAQHLAPRLGRVDLALLRASKRLRELGDRGDLGEDEALDDASSEAGAPPSARRWDAARVLRHLERETLSGGTLLRRARWLTVLADANVVYRERGVDRFLVIRAGEILSAGDAAGGEATLPRAERRSFRARKASFDGARYDRLRVLTTELRRVLGEGGTAAIELYDGLTLTRPKLVTLLAYV